MVLRNAPAALRRFLRKIVEGNVGIVEQCFRLPYGFLPPHVIGPSAGFGFVNSGSDDFGYGVFKACQFQIVI